MEFLKEVSCGLRVPFRVFKKWKSKPDVLYLNKRNSWAGAGAY